MSVHPLERERLVPRPVDEVFAFLERIFEFRPAAVAQLLGR